MQADHLKASLYLTNPEKSGINWHMPSGALGGLSRLEMDRRNSTPLGYTCRGTDNLMRMAHCPVHGLK